MSTAYIGLGSNQGDRHAQLKKARILINIYLGRITSASQLYLTEPWGVEDQQDFMNQVLSIHTELPPIQLHKELLRVEEYLGKRKDTKWGPRNIDIDILLYDELVIDTPNLQIPHERMHERNFVLIPLAEIGKDVIHPVLNLSIEQLMNSCTDDKIAKWTS